MIQFDQFGWRFAEASGWALRDISLQIECGEFVAVAGASASGKTTMALAMCGLLIGRHAGDATGSVRVSGSDVATLPLHQTAQTIALVQQNPETQFATLTVSDEIAFGMENRCVAREEIHRRSAKAMELLAIGHLRERSLATLSGGEKQRVAVASIVAGEPDVIVLDEPTASLDPQASDDLFHSLAELCRRAGLTVVIIEHKLDQLLPLNPRLICLQNGCMTTDTRNAASASRALRAAGLSPPERATAATAEQPSAHGEPLIQLSDVTITSDGHTLLNNASLEVRAGEVLAVLGPNGGGKTTLLHCLLGLVEPAGGSIRVCGMPVPPTAVSQLSRQIGLVFQNADHQLVADTVWGEALLAARNLKRLEPATEQQADRLLEQAGFTERKADHPYRLSWGQKRRLNLISVILHRPRLLLLDEPFAGQDWENVTFLLDAIDTVLGSPTGDSSEACSTRAAGFSPRGRTAAETKTALTNPRSTTSACLMVTHDPRIVQRSCTRLLFIAEGHIVVDAPVPEAFKQLLEMGHEAYVPAERNGKWKMENGK